MWPMEMRRAVRLLVVAALLALAVLRFDAICAALGLLWRVVQPLIVGMAIAYIVNLLETGLERIFAPHSRRPWVRAARRPACVALSYLILAAALAAIAWLVVPRIVAAVTLLVQTIGPLLTRAADWLRENYPAASDVGFTIDWQNIANTLVDAASKSVGGLVGSSFGLLGNVVSGVFSMFVAITFSAYLLIGKRRVFAQVARLRDAYLPARPAKRLARVIAVADESFRSFLIGQGTEAVILGALCTLGMWVFGFPYATTVGVFIGATSLIPVFGAYLGAIVGALLIVAVDPLRAVLFLLFIIVLQQLEGNLIYPRVVGTSVGLPGIWVFVAVVIGGGVGGVLGMLIGVPLAATAYKLIRGNVRERERADEA